MQSILGFLSANPILAVCICLTLGYLIGFIKIKNFAFGATIGTLVVGFVLSRFTSFNIPGILVTLFSLLFCFTIGYEAGPAFFKSLKSNGIKFVIHAVFFCGFSLLLLCVIGKCGLADRDTVIGIAAGALTQTSILTVADGLGDMANISYAVTYITGTLFAILFASVIGPVLLRTTPIMAAKDKISKNGGSNTAKDDSGDARIAPVYPRAFLVEEGAGCIGKNVEMLEDCFGHSLEVVKIFRDGKELAVERELVICQGDILTVISSVEKLVTFDDEFLREVSDNCYLAVNISAKEIIITSDSGESLVDSLSNYGIVLQKAVAANGKKLEITDGLTFSKGMVIKVSGVGTAIKKFADKFGYIKEVGSVTDVPFMFTALSAAIVFGALKFCGFGLGDSTCALIIGLVCGWYYNKNPKYGVYPESTRWFLKSVGLNLFIAVKALGTGAFSIDSKMLAILGIGIAVTLVPHIVTLLFSKYVLKMDDADILGGACGSGTCTAALNSLTDSSGSTVFVASFATTNAVGNILLTVLGVLLAMLI